jgi:hypothetical protein
MSQRVLPLSVGRAWIWAQSFFYFPKLIYGVSSLTLADTKDSIISVGQ